MTSSTRHKPQDMVDGSFGWRQIAYQWLALLVVAALGLSSLGPMMDHHFAERHPGHGHLFLGTTVSNHSHDFDSLHAHDVLSALKSAGDDPLDTRNQGIVYFTPLAGTGTGAADLTLPFSPPSMVGIGDGPDPLTAGEGYTATLSGKSIAPPTRPPRA